eukprot:352430-Chlamydomonas_euryale.AAC.3
MQTRGCMHMHIRVLGLRLHGNAWLAAAFAFARHARAHHASPRASPRCHIHKSVTYSAPIAVCMASGASAGPPGASGPDTCGAVRVVTSVGCRELSAVLGSNNMLRGGCASGFGTCVATSAARAAMCVGCKAAHGCCKGVAREHGTRLGALSSPTRASNARSVCQLRPGHPVCAAFHTCARRSPTAASAARSSVSQPRGTTRTTCSSTSASCARHEFLGALLRFSGLSSSRFTWQREGRKGGAQNVPGNTRA